MHCSLLLIWTSYNHTLYSPDRVDLEKQTPVEHSLILVDFVFASNRNR